jgi:hypothetical protein
MMIWGDYDNDGFMDAFIVGGQKEGEKAAGLYRNNGNSTFTGISPVYEISALARAAAAFIDYNNDGNLDLIVIGENGNKSATLYTNSGAPAYTFTKVANTSFPPVDMENDNQNPRTIQAFDYDNDGWTDLIINGHAGASPWQGQTRVVALFRNNHGTFEYQPSPVNGSAFRAVNGGSVNVGDVNNDGYPDVLISGYIDNPGGGVTDLYINNKNGEFIRSGQPAFTGHQEGETFFMDVNNDGWLDIIEIGRDLANGWNGFSNLYLNNKNNTFSRRTNPFSGGQAVVATGDVDNDGLSDFFVMGYATGTKLLYNKGNNAFEPLDFSESVRGGFCNLVDFNNDHTLDLNLFGYSDSSNGFFHALFRNDKGSNIPDNQAPAAPTGLTVKRENNKYQLTWLKATDDHTPPDALRYNVHVLFPDAKKYAYVPADFTNGKVKVNGLQPFITTTSIELNLPEDNYTFAVQAIDQANAGSVFTTPLLTGIDKATVIDKVGVSSCGKAVQITNRSLESVHYSIFSVNGQTILAGTCYPDAAAITNLASGIYIVKLSQGSGAKTIKTLVF